MNAVLKLVLMGIFLALAVVSGFRLYRFLNNKIIASNTWLQLAGWSLLLITALGGLFFAAIYLLILAYSYLAVLPQ